MMIMDYYKQSKVKKQRQQLEEQVKVNSRVGGQILSHLRAPEGQACASLGPRALQVLGNRGEAHRAQELPGVRGLEMQRVKGLSGQGVSHAPILPNPIVLSPTVT